MTITIAFSTLVALSSLTALSVVAVVIVISNNCHALVCTVIIVVINYSCVLDIVRCCGVGCWLVDHTVAFLISIRNFAL